MPDSHSTTVRAEAHKVHTGPFAALHERNYALLWAGNGLSHMGDQMAFVVKGWLVFELTDSALALGILTLASGAPRLLFGLIAGVLADRLDRRSVLFTATVCNMVASAVFATLVFTAVIEYWMVLVIALLMSVFSMLNLVTRQALIPDVVSRENLANAIALHSTMRGTTQIIGQGLAGVLIALIGVAGVLYINSASFVAMLVALFLMRIQPAPAPRLGFKEDLGRGLSYIRGHSDLFALLVLGIVPMLLIVPYKTLMPIFARDILLVGPEGYGVLMAASGVGGLIAAALLTVYSSHHRGAVLLGSLLALGAAMVAFAVSSTFLIALVALILVGATFNAYRVVSASMIQRLAAREMMGRVMGLYNADRGFQPIGGLLLGGLAAAVSAPFALALAGVLCAALTVYAWVWRSSIRRL